MIFFAKTLIEHTPKSNLKKHPSHPLVPLYNDYRSPSKYQVKGNDKCILAKTKICHFVHILITDFVFEQQLPKLCRVSFCTDQCHSMRLNNKYKGRALPEFAGEIIKEQSLYIHVTVLAIFLTLF